MSKRYSQEEMAKLIAGRVAEEEESLKANQQLDPGDEGSFGGGSSEEPDLAFVRRCYNANEVGDSLLFNYLHRDKFICNEVSEEWMVYKGPHWERDRMNQEARNEVEAVARQYLRLLKIIEEELEKLDPDNAKDEIKGLNTQKKAMIGRLDRLRSNRGRINVLQCSVSNGEALTINPNDMDLNPWLFPCANGVYDLQRREFREGRPEDYLTIASSIDWEGIDTPCPLWEKYLLEILGGEEEVVRWLQKVLGYSITGLKTEHLFVVFYGPHGRNGKGTLMNIVHRVLGSMAATIQTELLMDQKFTKNAGAPSPEIMDLKSRRIITGDETEKKHSFAVQLIKKFSGGNKLKGRGLQDKEMTEFEPTHVLFLLCNDRPWAPPDDDAFWERIHVVTFPNSYLPEYKCKKPHQKVVDKDLEQKLWQEAPGILAWLVRGNEMWQDEGLDPPLQVIEWSQNYRSHVDDLQMFIDDRCDVDFEDASTDNRENASNLYQAYKLWWDAENPGGQMLAQKLFSDQMVAKGFTKIKSGKNFYQYIKLKVDVGGSSGGWS